MCECQWKSWPPVVNLYYVIYRGGRVWKILCQKVRLLPLSIPDYFDRSSSLDFAGIFAWILNFLTVPYLVRNENINLKLRIISAASISIIFFAVIFYFYGNQGTSGALSNYIRMIFVLYIFSFNKFAYRRFSNNNEWN